MERGDAINQITVANELQLTNDLEAISGTSYLSQLVLSTPTSIHMHRNIFDLGNIFQYPPKKNAFHLKQSTQCT